jgi:hypothetical protein
MAVLDKTKLAYSEQDTADKLILPRPVARPFGMTGECSSLTGQSSD